MAETINLRQARKRAERTLREADAAQNRAKHGLTKAARQLREAEGAKARRLLDQAKRDPD